MDITDKTILITGGVSGIGEATARALAPQCKELLVHGVRPVESVRELISELRNLGKAKVEYFQADFSSLAEIRELAHRIQSFGRVDVLINNAVAPATDKRIITSDGIEKTLQVNYLAMVVLVIELHGLVCDRIVNVASETHQSAEFDFDDLQLDHTYSAFDGYRRSKLAIVTFSQWLARQLDEGHPSVLAVCPGLTETPLLHDMFPGSHGQSPVEAARNVLAGLDEGSSTGAYLSNGRLQNPNPLATDVEIQNKLVDATSSLLGEDIRGRIVPRQR